MTDASAIGQELNDWLRDYRRAVLNQPSTGVSVGDDGTIDLDYVSDAWNVSLIRILPIVENGVLRVEVKRFAGPRGEAYEAADDWRDYLRRGDHSTGT